MAAVFMVMYLPITTYSLYAMLKLRFHPHMHERGSRPENRRLVVEIVTNGQNPEVVEDIISRLRTYKTKFEIWVLKEDYDRFAYSANEIVVPSDYSTRNGSYRKMRAMQYGIEYLHNMGYGQETYIIHLDDDSIVNESYIGYVEGMGEEAGQGSIRLRGYGMHLMSTLADMIRVSDCDIYCRNFNEKGKPKLIHGEGLVIRADVEYEIGWDYGGYGAEDFIMGISIASRGYSFGYIPDYVYISPPVNSVDFYKQRRRWSYSIMERRNVIRRLNAKAAAFILYRYAVGFAGIVGWTVWIVEILMGHHLPLLYTVIGGYNLIMTLGIYEYGVWKTDKKYAVPMAILMIPTAFYESGAIIYMLLKPPRKNTFDVIKKVRI